MNLKARLAAAATSLSLRIHLLLLLIVPYTDDILQGVNEHLPALAQYLPANIYKAVGVAVVVANIVHAARRAHQQAKDAAHG
jgi:hypothetical protein